MCRLLGRTMLKAMPTSRPKKMIRNHFFPVFPILKVGGMECPSTRARNRHTFAMHTVFKSTDSSLRNIILPDNKKTKQEHNIGQTAVILQLGRNRKPRRSDPMFCDYATPISLNSSRRMEEGEFS